MSESNTNSMMPILMWFLIITNTIGYLFCLMAQSTSRLKLITLFSETIIFKRLPRILDIVKIRFLKNLISTKSSTIERKVTVSANLLSRVRNIRAPYNQPITTIINLKLANPKNQNHNPVKIWYTVKVFLNQNKVIKLRHLKVRRWKM